MHSHLTMLELAKSCVFPNFLYDLQNSVKDQYREVLNQFKVRVYSDCVGFWEMQLFSGKTGLLLPTALESAFQTKHCLHVPVFENPQAMLIFLPKLNRFILI